MFAISERRACRALGQPRSSQRYAPLPSEAEERLTESIVSLATQYGRYGYRRITTLLRWDGWQVNHKRVERIWRREGLKVPQKQPKQGRLWLNDGSCIRLRPRHPGHVWSYDFVADRTHNGRPLRMLTVIDEPARDEGLGTPGSAWRSAWEGGSRPKTYRNAPGPSPGRADGVVLLARGTRAHPFRQWPGVHIPKDPVLAERAGDTHAIHRAREPLGACPGRSPGNGYIESFNGKLRDELLNREIFYKLQEAQVLIERWRNQYNRRRPHSSLGNRPPAPEAYPAPFLRSPLAAATAFGLT